MNRLVLLALGIVVTTGSYLSHGGTILGLVRSAESDELLPKSRLHFYRIGRDSLSRIIETSAGNFAVIGVPAGEYSCFVSHPGYRPTLVLHIQVNTSGVTHVDFLLRPFRSAADSAGLDIHSGAPGSDYKMKFYRPDDKEYR